MTQKWLLASFSGSPSAFIAALRAIDVQLIPADLREIETALSKIAVHRGRMNEERMMAVDQTE
jgi:hypothetical protein